MLVVGSSVASPHRMIFGEAKQWRWGERTREPQSHATELRAEPRHQPHERRLRKLFVREFSRDCSLAKN